MKHPNDIEDYKKVPKEFKGVIHVWRVPLYGIYIYFSSDDKALFKFKNRTAKDSALGYGGFCLFDDDICIFVSRNETGIQIPTMSHEIFHAAMKVGDFVGLEPTLDSNEEIAYIITWMTYWVTECVKLDNKRLECKGKNCKSTKDKNHSKECVAEHERAYKGESK